MACNKQLYCLQRILQSLGSGGRRGLLQRRDGGESDNNYGFGDVIADESAPDTGDYDYEWSSGHRACGDDDN